MNWGIVFPGATTGQFIFYIFEVQKQLNHKFIADTCLYLDLNFEDVLRAATNPNMLQKNKEN
jgi:hypothetical protein